MHLISAAIKGFNYYLKFRDDHARPYTCPKLGGVKQNGTYFKYLADAEEMLGKTKHHLSGYDLKIVTV